MFVRIKKESGQREIPCFQFKEDGSVFILFTERHKGSESSARQTEASLPS